MKINPILINITKRFNKVSKKINKLMTNTLERSPKRDCVSFTANHIRIDFKKIINNPNSKIGIAFGKTLAKDMFKKGSFDLDLIQKNINKFFSDVKVNYIQEKFLNDSVISKADSSCRINSNFKLYDLKMDINPPKNKKKFIPFISIATHEATHLSQMKNNSILNDFLKIIAKGNIDKARTLICLNEKVFLEFYKNQPKYFIDIFKSDGKNLINDLIKKDIILEASKMPSKDYINLYSLYGNNFHRLIADTKKYCAIKSRFEKEAFAAQYSINRKFAPNEMKNTKNFIAYFYRLENLLSKED